MWRDRLITAALGLAALGLGGAIAAYVWALSAINASGPLRQSETVIIAPGSGLNQIGGQLARRSVIASAALFEFEARRAGQARALKPGEYSFDPGITLVQVLEKLVQRDVVARFVTIPEGLVSAEIVALLNKAEGLTGEIIASPADGALLPETYRYEWGDDRARLIERMASARNTALEQLWQARRADLPISSPEEAVILASIVEKETGVAPERGRVAAVFINRLRKRMRLQSDPTVIYGLNPTGLDRPLTRADLEQPNPFNTYLIDRLPPSPICHPGRAALAAVLDPPETDDLYFVADGSGGHAFAATLADHNRNVARWRRIEDGLVAPPQPGAQETVSKPRPKPSNPRRGANFSPG